jgi:hypothetical protein
MPPKISRGFPQPGKRAAKLLAMNSNSVLRFAGFRRMDIADTLKNQDDFHGVAFRPAQSAVVLPRLNWR